MNAKQFLASLFVLLIAILAVVAIVFDVWGYILTIFIGSVIVLAIVHGIQRHNEIQSRPVRRQTEFRRTPTEPRRRRPKVNEERLRNWVEQEFDKVSTYDNPESYR